MPQLTAETKTIQVRIFMRPSRKKRTPSKENQMPHHRTKTITKKSQRELLFPLTSGATLGKRPMPTING